MTANRTMMTPAAIAGPVHNCCQFTTAASPSPVVKKTSTAPATCAPISIPSPNVNKTSMPCAWLRIALGATLSV